MREPEARNHRESVNSMCGRERSPYRSLSWYEPIADEFVIRNEERCGERSLQQSDDSFTASDGLKDRVDVSAHAKVNKFEQRPVGSMNRFAGVEFETVESVPVGG